jgi:hypothetical protein
MNVGLNRKFHEYIWLLIEFYDAEILILLQHKLLYEIFVIFYVIFICLDNSLMMAPRFRNM